MTANKAYGKTTEIARLEMSRAFYWCSMDFYGRDADAFKD